MMVDDLGSPIEWVLKGEGNANLVFAYTGSDPRLAGRVLRVRKPRAPPAPQQAALEDAVWAPVLGPLAASHLNAAAAHSSGERADADGALAAAAAAAARREQLYVQRLLAPLLGRHHIPPHQPVRPSPAFLQQLLSASGVCSSSDAQAAAAAAGTAALLPDVTLLPGAHQQPQLVLQQHAQQQAQQQAQQPAGQPVGPVVCIELKPKCGFVASCGTVHPSNRELKHSRSRYQLHQLLKLSQGKIDACSAYDPCDLFSGDSTRLRSALGALLEQPQNNLLLFVEGQRQELAGQQRRKGQPQQQAQQAQQQQRAQQQHLEGQQSVPALEQLLGDLLPLPLEQRRDALAELLAAVLEREGVLPRLLQAQQQCSYDIEGIYRLYCKLAGLQPEEWPTGAADNGSNSSGGSGSTKGSGNGSGSGCEEADGSAAHAAVVAQLLALPEADAYAVLRSYVVSATAKDCAVMVALQRLDVPPAGAAGGDGQEEQAAASTAAAGPAAADAATAARGREAATQQCEEQWQRWDLLPPCIHCPSLGGGKWLPGSGSNGHAAGASGSTSAGGLWFRYRLCFVDLDLKPLAKIPAHAELDRRIVGAARRRLGAAGGATGVS